MGRTQSVCVGVNACLLYNTNTMLGEGKVALLLHLFLFVLQGMASCHCLHLIIVHNMTVAMATRHRRMNMCAVKYLGSGHQYTPMMGYVTYMVAIDTTN